MNYAKIILRRRSEPVIPSSQSLLRAFIGERRDREDAFGRLHQIDRTASGMRVIFASEDRASR